MIHILIPPDMSSEEYSFTLEVSGIPTGLATLPRSTLLSLSLSLSLLLWIPILLNADI